MMSPRLSASWLRQIEGTLLRVLPLPMRLRLDEGVSAMLHGRLGCGRRQPRRDVREPSSI